MGHLVSLEDGYKQLVKRLDAGQVGLPEPLDPDARKGRQEILEILFSPEEAWLATRMPNMPAKLEEIATRTKINTEELLPRLNSMADKGIIMDIVNPRTNKALYMLSPPGVGFFEFSMFLFYNEYFFQMYPIAEQLQIYSSYTLQESV